MLFILYVSLSVVAGFFASTKKRSGFGWFILSLCTTPVFTLILLAVLGERKNAPVSLEDKLKEIDRLKQQGTISEDEYNTKRKAIIESN